MGRQRTGTRVLGPYRDGDGWQYEIRYRDGHRDRCRLRPGLSEEGARQVVAEVRRELEGEFGDTVGQLADAYLAHLDRRGVKADTVAFAGHALRPLLARHEALDVTDLTTRTLERYLDDCAELSLATRRSYWLAVARFCKWLRKRRHLNRDVAAELKEQREDIDEPLAWDTSEGRRALGRGKVQLRNLAEARAYREAALALATPERRTAALLPLLTGISSGELRHLCVADVDLAAGVLWVRDDDEDVGDWGVKTQGRTRRLEIPGDCRDDLAALVDGRPAEARVYRQASGEARSATWLRKLVARVCADANVRVVCPHGLRDTHSSLRAEVAGELDARIGEALGHQDAGRTVARHYRGAAQRVGALRVVDGGKEC